MTALEERSALDAYSRLIVATAERVSPSVASLRVQAERDLGEYPTKVKVTDEEMAGLRLTPHAFHGEWNYTLAPARPTHV